MRRRRSSPIRQRFLISKRPRSRPITRSEERTGSEKDEEEKHNKWGRTKIKISRKQREIQSSAKREML